MSAIPKSNDLQSELFNQLSAAATGLANDELFAKIVASQVCGFGALPFGLGLAPQAFSNLLARHFPGCEQQFDLNQGNWEPDSRMEERQDLLDLLDEHRAGHDESEFWMARIVAASCMGGNHLWQDLGLWNRGDLSRLINDNFPALAAKNVRDMKWKKFLYKQLCEREGVYVCRSPSCEVCADYANCYGSEE